MKDLVIRSLGVVVSLPYRLPERLRYYLRRIVTYGRASALIPGLPASVQFDGRVTVVGNGRIVIGEQSRIGDLAEFTTEHGGEIIIGKQVRINRGATLCAYTRIEIGDFSMMGEFVSVRDANHGIKRGEYMRFQGHDTKPIKIGSDVWVGRGVCILPGVTIGDGALIGANSVVTKDVPDYAIAVGIPARAVRLRD